MARSEATIFLSGSRICTQDENHRSYRTLHEKPFFNISVFNDETLAAGANVKYRATGNSIIVIPLVGEIGCNSERYGPGQAVGFDRDLEICNPYENELVNYLYLEIDTRSGVNGVVDFDLDAGRDRLISIFDGISIGKYRGRSDDVFKNNTEGRGVFVFVVEGVFEVQDRLLHARDGLALWKVDEVEFEALSDEAIVVFLNT